MLDALPWRRRALRPVTVADHERSIAPSVLHLLSQRTARPLDIPDASGPLMILIESPAAHAARVDMGRTRPAPRSYPSDGMRCSQ